MIVIPADIFQNTLNLVQHHVSSVQPPSACVCAVQPLKFDDFWCLWRDLAVGRRWNVPRAPYDSNSGRGFKEKFLAAPLSLGKELSRPCGWRHPQRGSLQGRTAKQLSVHRKTQVKTQLQSRFRAFHHTDRNAGRYCFSISEDVL